MTEQGFREGSFTIQMTHPSNNRGGGHTVLLQIGDAASGVEILNLELNAEQFTAMLGNHYLSSVKGEILTEKLFGRVGKKSEFTLVPFPAGIDKDQRGSEPNKAMTEFSDAWLKEHPEWDEAFWTRTNSGWELSANRYVAIKAK